MCFYRKNLWYLFCRYRDAGKQVAEVLKKFTPLLERASVDEAYLDITESVEKRIVHLTKRITEEHLKNTYVVGSTINDFLHNVYEDEDLNISDLKLAIGGVVAELLRAEVYKETGNYLIDLPSYFLNKFNNIPVY